MDTTSPLRICIVDDNPKLRLGLRRLLEREPDMSVAGEADSIADAKSLAAGGEVDLYVVDLGLGKDSGFDLITWIREHAPEAGVVVLSWHNEYAYKRRSLELGAHAYVAKSDPPTTLVSTLRNVRSARKQPAG
jgi:DNA-binding NarL/FixJ family response regulator